MGPPETYTCENSQCVISSDGTGVSKEGCAKICLLAEQQNIVALAGGGGGVFIAQPRTYKLVK